MAVKTFTTGEKLTTSDTNTYLNNGGLVYVTSQAVGSAVSSVTVSNAFSTTYDNYRIIYNGGTTSTSGYWQMRLGASNATYYGGLMYVVYSTGTVAGLGLNNAQQFSYIGGMNQSQTSICVDVFSPYLAKFTYVTASSVINGSNYGQFIGDHETATSYTDFTLYTSTGTATGGTITVYGYRKA